MTTFRKSVPKPANGSGAPRGKNPILKVVPVADIAIFPPSDANGVRTVGNLVLKQGKFPLDFYATDDAQKHSHALEGDPDAEGFLKKTEASHPGDEIEVNEFLQNFVGEGFIILYPVDCDGILHKILGTKCNPLFITAAEFTDDKDGIKHLVTFAQRRRDKLVAKFYDGVIPVGAPTNTVVFDYTLTEGSGPVFQLPTSAVEDTVIEIATTLAPSNSGKVITFIGGGGVEPASFEPAVVAAGSQVLLKDSTPWIALKDATINFKLFYTPGLADGYHLVEVSRT